MKIYCIMRKNNNSLVTYFITLDDAVNYIKTIQGYGKYKVVILIAEDEKANKESHICKLVSNSGYDISDW